MYMVTWYKPKKLVVKTAQPSVDVTTQEFQADKGIDEWHTYLY